VTQVVRGDDLLDSTPRQILLQRLLGYPTPAYLHVPLVLNDAGRRLAKRDGAVTLADLAEVGVTPDAVVAWIARSLDLPLTGVLALADLVDRFDPTRLPRGPITAPTLSQTRSRGGRRGSGGV
jgi:glutamyl-tRNA synthetase